jgi:M3 family oligoendopeptidase
MDTLKADGIDFKQISVATPDVAAISEQYHQLTSAWNNAQTADARFAIFTRWDDLRRTLQTWQAHTRLRYDQDTRDPQRKAEREHLDRIGPKLTALEIEMKRTMLGAGREDLESRLGRHLFALWEADVSTFSPEIELDLTRESQLEAQYIELIASAEFLFEGKSLNMSLLEPFTQSPDRDMRYRAQRTKWAFFAEHGDELDRIFDEMVHLRDSMARKLGFENFIELGYRRNNRVDYGRREVENYRDQVARDVVPIAAEIVAHRAKRLGLAKPMYWDENVVSPEGNPKPQGDGAWVVAQARDVFRHVDSSIADFYAMMIRHELVDLRSRDGKAGGGYCTTFTRYGVPFIFANFNGTHGDVNVLVHEMGHAFADWQSRSLPAFDYLSPTFETAEIHSMSMEYLTAPYLDRFFGAEAERYRRQHLEDAMLFLPYGVAVDHFQHLVYAQPDATPADRHRMWQQMEAKYMHWRRYGDLQYPAKGGLWQAKPHIYQIPFYYIDYALALCCALQFWAKSRHDYRAAVADYLALCKRGGEAPFTELVRAANLRSPFEDGSLRRVAEHARSELAA